MTDDTITLDEADIALRLGYGLIEMAHTYARHGNFKKSIELLEVILEGQNLVLNGCADLPADRRANVEKSLAAGNDLITKLRKHLQ